MTRPQIIRADTIDLQDHDQPSAKDHTRGRPQLSSVAPHQASAMKQAADQQYAERSQGSPRVSSEWVHGENGIEQVRHDDAGSRGTNGQDHNDQNGETADDSDLADAEGDDGLDDDMMDKISSSPSIDDGEYYLPPQWPSRVDFLRSNSAPETPPASPTLSVFNSSSPYTTTPVHLPLSFSHPVWQEDEGQRSGELNTLSEDHHHLQGGYAGFSGHDDRFEFQEEDEDVATPRANPPSTRPEYSTREMLTQESINGYDDNDGHDDIDDFYLHIDNGSPGSHSLSSSGSGSTTAFYSAGEDYEDYGDYEDDDADDISFSDDPRSADSGLGAECLQEIEDIDFEFVYALHTFVATVEGQANATKGDTMVLLDDSNSYWWLVRVVKDSSIGYLPAEHIETPTERLARLNKHRNIDLSATMLGDNPEKSKNPLKKAIRRRNAKTVQFAAPTYFEASDVDYSSSEGEGEEEHGHEEEEVDGRDAQRDNQDEITVVEPLRITGPAAKDDKQEKSEPSETTVREVKEIDRKASSDLSRTSDEMFDRTGEGVAKSRMGTVRNTDSFFKDDSVETRKITLTPNLLRDDSSTSTVRSNESKELKSRASMDTLEKVASPPGTTKEEKKKKEKRPGMLSGLFKRSNKKKNHDEDTDDSFLEKQSGEISRESPNLGKNSEDSSRPEVQAQPVKQAGKLKKQPPSDLPPTVDQEPPPASPVRETVSQQSKPPDRPAPRPEPSVGAPTQTMRLVEPETGRPSTDRPAPLQVRAPEQAKPERNGNEERTKDSHEGGGGVFAPLTNMIKSSHTHSSSPKPEKVKKATRRVSLDDFDSSPETDDPPRNKNPFASKSASKAPDSERSRLSESPVHLTHADAAPSQPPALLIDTSSQEASSSPVSPPSSSPETVEGHDHRGMKGYDDTPNSTAGSASATPTWSDASLRTYFEDNNDIRDLLIVVHDNSNVVPAGPDHPLIGGLFQDEKTKLTDIGNRLDDLLGGWLARKTANR